MIKYLKPQNLDEYVHFEDISHCPICSSKISPTYLSSECHLDKTAFSVYCECTSCGKPFIVLFKNLERTVKNNRYYYSAENIEYLAPIFPDIRIFDNRIETLSPMFVETYNQALSAESYNLNQIAGIGYRKSLEFLIKDYCASKNPNDKDKIFKMLLGQCINDYIDDDKIKKSSKVSAWLGNDETHYIKKFEDKDINDLKRFIDTVVYFILYNLNVDEADEIINSQ